jgi:hypothetical protein
MKDRLAGLRIWNEPLLHFLAAGVVLFAVHTWMNPQGATANSDQEIHVRSGDVAWLVRSWSAQWGRDPTPEELQELVADYVNEQLLAREAKSLGLEDGDVVIRRRLAQKLIFLIEDTSRRAEPSEEELQRFYRTHSDRFRDDGRISFSQIYFNPGRRADARWDAVDALKRLAAGPPLLPEDLGDRLMLDTEFHDVTERAISAAFGHDFAQAVFSVEAGGWRGPLDSGYGVHLVRVSARHAPELRPFPEVRELVVEQWRGEQEKAAKERYLAELRKKYGVVIDPQAGPVVANAAGRQRADR